MLINTIAATVALGITTIAGAGTAHTSEFVFEYDSAALHTTTGHTKTKERLAEEARDHCTDKRVRGLQQRRLEQECEAEIVAEVEAELGLDTMRLSQNER